MHKIDTIAGGMGMFVNQSDRARIALAYFPTVLRIVDRKIWDSIHALHARNLSSYIPTRC